MFPFTREEFFTVFSRYNGAVWPAQLLLLGSAVVAGWIAALQPGRRGSRAVWRILGILWLWTGLVYYLAFLTAVSRAAWAFGSLFALQGLLFIRRGVVEPKPAEGAPAGAAPAWPGFHVASDRYGWTGAVLAAYAVAAYPVLIRLSGHAYPAGPTFGAPSPVVLYSFALLLWAKPPVPPYLLLIPFLWALMGAWTAISLAIWPDAGVTVGGLVATALVLARNRAEQPRGLSSPGIVRRRASPSTGPGAPS